ncbi:DUF3037 domain-containing protein [Kumtagia ephedrae]|uniref:DUF3037 domain-containing protein n=1 Tax=Kumtagia ephedrae TaxID=2116701 RepID=A0A2P7S493_9HYPH|nr:DUF3037 domain-containing protein [Mesorhizobium ephedrae]PSJ57287.1 DUF3037 domain-containing protein [Mesorhizobium ephedrae]
MMNRLAVRYAIIRFQPHVETEEFANIGVVLVAPEMGYLDFRIETRRIGRLTAFFDALDARLIRQVLGDCRSELQRLAGYDRTGQSRLSLMPGESAEHLFATLTKDREGIIRYSDVRYAMHLDPAALLDQLFDHYVARAFADIEYKERLLERHVRQLLSNQQISARFRSKVYSDGLYTARFPFVGDKDGEDRIVLKPIYLGQKEPMNIFDHANKWLFRVNRLRRQLPEHVTFAVEGPAGPGPSDEAFQEVSTLFERNHIEVISPEASALLAIARHLQ